LWSTNVTDCPGFTGMTTLSNVVLRLPKLSFMGQQFVGVPMTNDVSDVVDPGWPTIYWNAFQNCYYLKGCLVLTNLVAFTRGNEGNAFAFCRSLQDIRMGGPCENLASQYLCRDCTSVTNIVLDMPRLGSISGYASFYNCSNVVTVTLNTPALTNFAGYAFGSDKPNRLGSIVFGMTNVFTVGAFKNCPALTNLVFYGPMPSTATMDNLLTSVAAGTTNHACVIYASRHQADWLGYWRANPVSDEERAANLMPPNCRGVYLTAGGARKAWIVEQDSPYDVLKYFYIRVCVNAPVRSRGP